MKKGGKKRKDRSRLTGKRGWNEDSKTRKYCRKRSEKKRKDGKKTVRERMERRR